jgi:hypothetical protein
MMNKPFADVKVGSFKNSVWLVCFARSRHTFPSRQIVTVIDRLSMLPLGSDVAAHLPAERVLSLLDKLIQSHGRPGTLQVDFGLDVPRRLLFDWCIEQGIELRTVPAWKPANNGADEMRRNTNEHG